MMMFYVRSMDFWELTKLFSPSTTEYDRIVLVIPKPEINDSLSAQVRIILLLIPLFCVVFRSLLAVALLLLLLYYFLRRF